MCLRTEGYYPKGNIDITRNICYTISYTSKVCPVENEVCEHKCFEECYLLLLAKKRSEKSNERKHDFY